MPPDEPLTAEERATYEWQMWVPGLGEEGQRKLKAASVLITRVGGLGGLVAYELAAAGGPDRRPGLPDTAGPADVESAIPRFGGGVGGRGLPRRDGGDQVDYRARRAAGRRALDLRPARRAVPDGEDRQAAGLPSVRYQ